VICGAVNFAVGDRVPLALPGAVLPGGFEIGARKTYGHISEGMICSARSWPSARITPASSCCRRTRRSAPISCRTRAARRGVRDRGDA
jgi:hypothetical protein